MATSPWPRPLVTVPAQTMAVVPSAAWVTAVAGKLMVPDPLGEFQVQVRVLPGSLTELRQLALWLMVRTRRHERAPNLKGHSTLSPQAGG